MKDRIKTKDGKPEKADTGKDIQGTTIRPKAAEPVPVEPISEVEDLNSFEDQNEQERVTEGLSISVPTQPLLRPTGLGKYFNKNVRVLFRDGNTTAGFLQGRSWDYLHILNFVETGKDERLTGSWCGVAVDSVSRIYPGDVKVERISKS